VIRRFVPELNVMSFAEAFAVLAEVVTDDPVPSLRLAARAR
jgi:hypothetical protein